MIEGFAEGLFDNKTVAITGAGSGIGKSTAKLFATLGATVYAHLGRTPADEKLSSSIHAMTADFTVIDAQQAFIDFVHDHTSTVDVLINNAGTMVGRFPADTLSDAEYAHIVALNQDAVVRITRGLIPTLKKGARVNGSAAIVNTVSISASTGGSPGSSIYSASKAFVSTYTKALAKELAPHNIRTNAVSPGVIHTDFHERYSTAEKLENTRQQIPLQRLGTAEDCAPAFVFLSSPSLSGYISGQTLEINGGQF